MMKFKKKSLVLALGTVLGGISLIPAAQAVNLATDGLGQALIFPYYTTRAGWNTLFNITNTSNNVVALKVRFHETYNSRDVFDFNVILSPYDVWSGWVENGANNIPVFKTTDNSCTVPRIVPNGPGQPFQGNGANGLISFNNTPGGDQAKDWPDSKPAMGTTDRLREGYVVVLAMGMSAPDPTTGAYTPLAANAIHTKVGNNAGVPKNCAKLRTAFSRTTVDPTDSTVGGIANLRNGFPTYGVNPLKGAFSLVNGAQGWNASGSATTLADFRTSQFMTFQLPPSATIPYDQSFHEPDLSSANTPGQVLREYGGPVATGPTGGADATTFVLQRASVVNQWANRTDPANGWLVKSDWILTFPTKRFYVDNFTYQFAGRATGRTGLPTTLAPFANDWSTAKGYSCDEVSYVVYDREEFTSTDPDDPLFSPAPTPEGQSLCYETNVLSFGGATILGSKNPSNVPIEWLPADNGWMQLTFTGPTGATAPFAGLPVVGFAPFNRTTPNGALNEAYLVDHAYTRVPR